MHLSTRGRYATRAMLELARHYGEGPMSARTLSRSQGISARYLQQLLGTLRQAGLVKAQMGPGGGFALAAAPDRIDVGAILDVTEGRFGLVECVTCPKACRRAKSCQARTLWVEASRLVDRYTHTCSLADVLAGRLTANKRASRRRA